MNADQVLDAYVRDVARCLPRDKRNDVAFELRALLAEELAARVESAGRAPDRAMAMELLRGFGRPAEAARRYHERPAVIDPADTPDFLIWAAGGAVTVSVLRLVSHDPAVLDDLFLKWLGILVLVFAAMAAWRRRTPGVFRWKPKPGPDWMPRGLGLLALVCTLAFPVAMYAAPQRFVEIAFFGALPSNGVALTPEFQASTLRAVTLGFLLVLPLGYALVTVQGRWTRWSSRPLAIAHACLGPLFLVHATLTTAAGEPQVFVSPLANRNAGPVFAAVGAGLILTALYEAYREWARITPAPRLENRPAA